MASLMIGVAIAQGSVRVAVKATPSARLLAAATKEAPPTAKPTLAPTRSPDATSTPDPTPSTIVTPISIPFHVINATSCNPSLVPSADATAAPRLTAPKKFALAVPILMYHRIVPLDQAAGSRPSLVVTPQVFDAQLAAAQAAGWHTITAGQLGADLAAGIKPPAKTFVITIDDGWKDGYTYALPILEKHNFVATYYVIASRINYGSFLDAWQLREMIAAGDEIGDHTVTHVALGRMTGTRLTYEIDAGAASIAEATGHWPVTFAYPSGSFSVAAEQAVQACSTMRMAVIEGDSTNETWAGRFQAPRLRIDNSTRPSELLALLARPAILTSQPAPTSSPRPANLPGTPRVS